MTIDHDEQAYEPPQATSPTDHILNQLQLHGYRPFQDEPDPRPLPGGTLPVPYVFVADAAFPMSVNLLRPFPSGSKEFSPYDRKIYDYRLSRARYAAVFKLLVISQQLGSF